MATTYRTSVQLNVWKQHTCLHCGCKYRYLLKRTLSGKGSSEKQAAEAAERSRQFSVENDIDMVPCPTCGLYQPDMVAGSRGWWQALVLVIFFIACFVPTITSFITHGEWYAPWMAVALAVVALVAHVLCNAGNPNRRPQHNRQRAQRQVDEGDLVVTTPGDLAAADNLPSETSWRPAKQRVVYGLFILGILLLPAGELLRLVAGWPNNHDWRPHSVGPGDRPYIYLPAKVVSIEGSWSGTGTAVLLNADELGVDKDLKFTTQSDSWGDKIYSKSSDSSTEATLWAQVDVPDDPKLAGKTLHIKIDLEIKYPHSKGGGFEDKSKTATHTADLMLANAAKVGRLYKVCYWFGFFGGLLMTIAASMTLTIRAQNMRSKALPTEIYTPEVTAASRKPPRQASDQIQ